ncbi:MAG: outer membrane beta-barrel protein [Sterolibacterium sp.]
MKRIGLGIAVISALVCGQAFAADEALNEFGGQIMLGSAKVDNGGGSNSFGMGSVYYGRFVMPNVEIVGELGYMAAGEGDSTTLYGIGARYFFAPVGKQGNIAPYIGADVGGSTSKNSPDSTNWDIRGGIKYFISDRASINLEYLHREDKVKDVDTKLKLDLLQVGVSTLF